MRYFLYVDSLQRQSLLYSFLNSVLNTAMRERLTAWTCEILVRNLELTTSKWVPMVSATVLSDPVSILSLLSRSTQQISVRPLPLFIYLFFPKGERRSIFVIFWRLSQHLASIRAFKRARRGSLLRCTVDSLSSFSVASSVLCEIHAEFVFRGWFWPRHQLRWYNWN